MSQPLVVPEAFRRALLDWYGLNRRILPWREDPTPYHVWVSEIMLQQTQVQTVLPYYERFMEVCPTVADLAALSIERLHKLWEGLGYYSRADHLHEAAGQIMARYDGDLPDSFDALLTLPGIGPYTAGAIASIAFGRPVCAVDGNVLRILSRVTAYEGAVNTVRGAGPLRQLAQSLVPQDRPGDFNQALMDLGAMICLANGSPRCNVCPLAAACMAHKEGLTDRLPVKQAKKARKTEEHTIVLAVCQGRVFIKKRPEKGLLAGLWEFLDLEGTADEAQVQQALTSKGFSPSSLTDLGQSRHLFTHREWQMQGWLALLDEAPAQSDGLWVTPQALQTDYAVASALSYYKNKLYALIK